ncbi:lasso peptide biosynthesis B2 protein [Caulobacter sp. UNC358MFTsu5.1]|uniref:lasso peptide biosynthesis B2 protein n=1 Tax=Caulobacter sp. UNC358MFTsu5.1 TaxID=1449049 RepID=UPI0004A72641|nr:lasso peptide biosynthesis B2 protein [Caulobacter sp. UNC358MFTsu5.1]
MHLRPDVHAARVGQDIVLLDVGRGEYLCLADAAQAFELPPAGPARILDPDLAEDAAALGLLGGGAQRPVSWPAAPRADLPTDAGRAIGPRDLADGLAVFAALLRHYYGRAFPYLVAYAQRPRAAAAPVRLTPALTDQVQAFRRLLPWAPFQGVCLYRSFLLLAFLRRRGLDARWVFGVRTWPFEAHCWLQADDVVLDDTLDHVRPFTPIFAV